MTPDEHENQATSAERETTELYPFSSGYPRDTDTARGPLPDWQAAADQPLPDLPVLEQLPDPDALPDPGYPAMPASPPPLVAAQPLPMRPPWPVPSATAEPGAELGTEPEQEPEPEAEPEPPSGPRESALPVTPVDPLPAAPPIAPEEPAVPVTWAEPPSVEPLPAGPLPAGPSSAPPPSVEPPSAGPPFVPSAPARPSFTPSAAPPPSRPTEFASGRVDLPPWSHLRAEPPRAEPLRAEPPSELPSEPRYEPGAERRYEPETESRYEPRAEPPSERRYEPTHSPSDQPDASPWDRPDASRWDRPDEESGPRLPAYLEAEPRPPAQRPLDVQPTWTSDPYRPPRPPEAAPPLHGPSVPWSEVRVGNPYQPSGETRVGNPYPSAAEIVTVPPSLRPPTHTEETPPDVPSPGASGAPGARSASAMPASAMPPTGVPVQRHTADTLTSDLLLPGKRATPDGGWRRTVYRATGGLIRVGESAASMYRRDLISRVRAPVAGGHHRVAVLSLKGGVGKTTATVGLGSTLASLRGDRVIAVDGNPDRGTLSDKVHLETAATIRDLLNERAMVTRYADVRAYTSQASSRLEILASDRDPGVSVAFSADDYRAVVGVLEHFYSICITDCGTGLLHSAMAGILELADQVVLVSSPSVDGARSASATLDWLEAHDYGDLVRGGVVVLSAIRRKSKSTVDLDRLEQHFAARCRAVVRVPYDAHLEEGAEVELEMLNDETADAYLELAALVADGFAHPRRSVAGTTSGFPLA
jgi:MinD-like ATPase involved in chromosome partitioning or flagellar assembly